MSAATDDLEEDDTADPFYENLENSNGKVIIFIARGVGKCDHHGPRNNEFKGLV